MMITKSIAATIKSFLFIIRLFIISVYIDLCVLSPNFSPSIEYNFYMYRKVPVTLAMILAISISSFAQSTAIDNGYNNLNAIDKISLKTYCALSAVFESADERIKCRKQEEVKLAKPTQNDTENTAVPAVVNQVVTSDNAVIEELRSQIVENRKDIETLIVKSASSTPQKEVATQTITKYVVSNKVADNGFYNTMSSKVVFDKTQNSLKIGPNDLAKITILYSTTTNSGWVGINTTAPLANESLRVGGKVTAKAFEVNSSADIAEMFPADEALTPGDIVMFGNNEYSWSTGGKGDTAGEYKVMGVIKAVDASHAIGVVATNPGVILGGDTHNGVPVAFGGRVPVRVTAENGPIEKGDRITLSKQSSGAGSKLIDNGQSVGVALSADTGKGIVLMLVKNEYVYSINAFK